MKRYRRPGMGVSAIFSEHLLNDYACKIVFRLIFAMRKVAEKSFQESFSHSSLYNFVGID